ncbi:hypothetical protein RMSM_07420 [Rhodopirellula maiorica SM1]|uniref:PilZ domain-containing protein n=1 Tax=Rhodopirellula maiorica SM1 TaxID=1265738 RepID=M5R8D7_9BACT|nr:hypothetical protein RMSM_07420 [Rhodopirellula maiorica SM1]
MHWDIQLPVELSDYFASNGEASNSFPTDERSNQRISIRTRGLLWSDVALPFCPRPNRPIGIYTRDFSRTGAGFLSSVQFFPEEELRVVLPTFWVRVRVTRVRRLGEACFEIGTILLHKYSPSLDAFEPSLEPQMESTH